MKKTSKCLVHHRSLTFSFDNSNPFHGGRDIHHWKNRLFRRFSRPSAPFSSNIQSTLIHRRSRRRFRPRNPFKRRLLGRQQIPHQIHRALISLPLRRGARILRHRRRCRFLRCGRVIPRFVHTFSWGLVFLAAAITTAISSRNGGGGGGWWGGFLRGGNLPASTLSRLFQWSDGGGETGRYRRWVIRDAGLPRLAHLVSGGGCCCRSDRPIRRCGVLGLSPRHGGSPHFLLLALLHRCQWVRLLVSDHLKNFKWRIYVIFCMKCPM